MINARKQHSRPNTEEITSGVVEKATIPAKDIVAPKALADLTYTGQTQTLIEAGSVESIESTEVVMQYALGNAEGPTEEWSVTLPAATEAGTYYVWYRVEGGNNYEDTEPQCVTATINALPTYVVTYSANGGSGTMVAGTATQGVPFALPACGFTAPDGKMFKGWSYEANGAVITDSKINVISGITLYAIWTLGRREALAILLIRVFLGNIIAGNVMAMAYSLAGGLLCWVIMSLLKPVMGRSQIWLMSILGALGHNAGQLGMAILISGTTTMIWYAPVLIVAAVVTGAFTGYLTQILLGHMDKLQKHA